MKKLITALFVSVLTVSLCGICSAKELKIGYVDVYEIFQDYSKTKSYDAILEKERSTAAESLEKQRDDLEKMQSQLSVMKDSEKEKQEDKIKAAIAEYTQNEKEAYLSIKQKRDDKMKEIIEDINKVVSDYAKTQGYDLIINKATVLYGLSDLDISKTILDEMEAKTDAQKGDKKKKK
ncbi:MAG: OmpH family outer membrane protein [Candidatus Omnitrophica bacterium]|nr:OmpH family outer membrane protein [Candidatus Omnitrophota bacterium]MDD5080415.1 OmpH family outer membrane protein [Candidatus Omnitrophota bacterium]MDD5441095.1 OmpH family outer membrane protein [Candidatus Omnitrophota bacterium]